MNWAKKLFEFHRNLKYTGGPLPEGISVMNPFQESPTALEFVKAFLYKFFDDENPRQIILGINPGRFGGGVTGIPFTDTKRLVGECDIPYDGPSSHEPSSVFIYDMINAYGGPRKFYQDFYINSPSPLGYTSRTAKGGEINYNYYDSKELSEAVKPFMIDSMERFLKMGFNRKRAYCLGTGKNWKFLQQLNKEHDFFDEMIPLEHPRYIMQYKYPSRQEYIDKYLTAFTG
jgi:hypothetical protein